MWYKKLLRPASYAANDLKHLSTMEGSACSFGPYQAAAGWLALLYTPAWAVV
jgi:hypothetical protein